MPRIESTDYKCNKQKGPSEDASIPLRRGKKIIMGGRRRDLGERVEQERSPEDQENEWI